MPRSVSCRRCGHVSNLSLCNECRLDTYGSSEYRINSLIIRKEVKRRISLGIPVLCVICGFKLTEEITIEHLINVSAGGTNNLDNLAPAHATCNYGRHRAD